MTIINAATNASVGGVKIPLGAFEWPEHGVLVVSNGVVWSNAVVGSGDYLVVDDASISVRAGVDVFQGILLGVLLSFGYIGLLAAARRIAKFISGGAVKEV